MRFSWHGVFNYYCLRAMQRLRKQVGVDIVYLTEMKLARFLLARKNKLTSPFVYEVHGLYAQEYKRADKVEGEVFRSCDALVTTTESLQRVMTEIYHGLPPLYRVPLASDVHQEIPFFDPPALDKPWRICYIGQLYPLQGVDLLIHALSRLPLRFVVDIIGGRPEQIESLRMLARQMGQQDRVFFHGFVPPAKVVEKASAAHIFVVPCRAGKKMPFVAHTKIYEYFSLGRPVVAADLPSIREEVEDGITGLLFKAEDPGALAAAIEQVAANQDFARQLAAKAKEKSRQYSWEMRAERLGCCFKEILEKT